MSSAHGDAQPGQPLADASKVQPTTVFEHVAQPSHGMNLDSESKITPLAIIQGRKEETRPSAAIRCFAISEVFERVLQNTSSTEISRYRYVCRTWKVLIENSPSLERRLLRALAGQQAAAAARLSSARLHFSRRYRRCALHRQTKNLDRVQQSACHADSESGSALAASPTTSTRFFAIAELCEQVLQYFTSKSEIFLCRLVYRTWKMSIEGSPLLKRKLLTISVHSKRQSDEYPGDPSGINDLIFKGRPANMPQPRNPYHMLLYYRDPDNTTGPQNNPALEQLDMARDAVLGQMFLTRPPVSCVYTTWKLGRTYMEMELHNALGAKVKDLTEHLEEHGRMPGGEPIVGMSLVELVVVCSRRQIPRGGKRRIRKARGWNRRWEGRNDDAALEY